MEVFLNHERSIELGEVQHLALGFFDGLHLGHKSVIIHSLNNSCLEKTGVVSFWPHPQTVLGQGEAPPMLTTLAKKQSLLEDWRIGYFIVLPFTQEFSRRPPATFLDWLNISFPNLKSLSVGPNFRFGFKREGSPFTLGQWSESKNIAFHLGDFVLSKGEPISSSRIRECIQHGEIEEANAMLGRPYSIQGLVIHGAKRGKTLGFPTANLKFEDGCRPLPGVYYANALLPSGQSIPAAVNFGYKPSITDEKQYTVEAHLIDWQGNLYDKSITLELMQFLRPEKLFSGVEALRKAIARDVESCRSLSN